MRILATISTRKFGDIYHGYPSRTGAGCSAPDGLQAHAGKEGLAEHAGRVDGGGGSVAPAQIYFHGNRTECRWPRSSSIARTGLWIVASRADGYRRRACLEMAGTFKDRDAGATLAHMAQVWLRLADNCEDVNEGARGSKAAEQGQPVVQQQQRNQPKQGEL